jgi:hypothetical protein
MRSLHPRRSGTLGLLVAALAITAGCAASPGDDPASGDGEPSTSAVPSRSFEAVPRPSGSGEGIPSELLDRVIADAASGADVNRSDVEVVTAEAVTWSDGSLGCPEPGMMYTQALVPGYRVVLEIDGEHLHFHSGSSGELSLCEDPLPGAAGDGSR